MIPRRLGRSAMLAATVTSLAPSLARAEDGGVETGVTPTEIVVTAQRRVERQRDVPVAITAFSGMVPEAADLADAKAVIRFTPGFSGMADNNFVDGIAIRGIASNDYGVGGDPSIGIFRDGIHQGRTGSAITTAYDLERVEALRGPQVFLFGRNAISGALAIVTAAPDPDSTGGYASARLGTRDRAELLGVLNAPLGNGWALRIAADREKEDGSSSNAAFPDAHRIGGRDVGAGRLSLLHRGEATTVRLTGEYEDRNLGGVPHRARETDGEVFDLLRQAVPDLAISSGRRDVDSDLPSLTDRSRVASLTLRIDHDAGNWTLTSLTGLRAHRFGYTEDYDGTPLVIDAFATRQRGRYASQEFTATSTGAGPVAWSLGLSSYHERIRANYENRVDETLTCTLVYAYPDCAALTADLFGRPYLPTADGTLADVNRARGRNRGVSAYGSADWRITPAFTLGAGARWTYDHKRFDLAVPPVESTLGNIVLSTYYTEGFVRARKGWTGLSPRLYLRWQPSGDWTLYASATRGTKAGGFGTFSLVAPVPLDDFGPVPPGTWPDDYGEEKIRSFEAGAKGRLPAGLGTAALTVFHYVYEDLQANVYDPALRSTQVINIGRVRGYGVEGEAALTLGRHVDLTLNAAYVHTAKRGDRDCPLADCGGLGDPIVTGGAILRAHVPVGGGEAYAQGEASFSGKARRVYDDRGFGRTPSCGRADARGGYAADAGWSVEAYVRNLTNAICYAGADSNGGVVPATLWGPILARSAGLAVTRRF